MAIDGYCMTEGSKAFLIDLIDLTEIIGPRGLESECQAKVEPGEECKLDDPVFETRLKALVLELTKIPTCAKEKEEG